MGYNQCDNIIDNIFVCDIDGAVKWEGPRLCVIEYKNDCKLKKKNDFWIPIIKEDRFGDEYADIRQLDKASDLIEEYHQKGEPFTVHCWQGMERSALAVAYWLHTKHGMTMGEAYSLLKEKRPIVQDRTGWLRMSGRSDEERYDNFMDL